MEYRVVADFSRRPLKRENLFVVYSKDCDSCVPSELSRLLEPTWEERKRRTPSLFSGPVVRLGRVFWNNRLIEDWEATPVLSEEIGHLKLMIGLSDYKTFLTTNHQTDPRLLETLSRAGRACFADPIGDACLVRTSDGHIPLILRSERCAEWPSHFDVPGGHPEISCVGPGEHAWREEFFDSVLREVRDEIHLVSDENLAETLALMGIISKNHGATSFVYQLETTQTWTQIAQAYATGEAVEANESTLLLLAPLAVFASGAGAAKVIRVGWDGKSTEEMEMSEVIDRLVPNAHFVRRLLRRELRLET